MEEHLNSLSVTHLLQHTLRSLCFHDNSQWIYAVFWRILPRNYPPPKWDNQAGVYDRSRGNRRNWILVWEDGFCNFAAAATAEASGGGSSVYGNCEMQHYQGIQPELFFKMSHEIYNYGEGLIGKVAADHNHKWIHNEPNDQEINFLSAWHNSSDSHPRTWEAQFQCGIKTIALIAVREGVIQLGSIHKIMEDVSYVMVVRKKLSYIESIPGVLLPHPSSTGYPFKIDTYGSGASTQDTWHHLHTNLLPTNDFYDNIAPSYPMKITPSMSSLEALLSKLPSVVPVSSSEGHDHHHFYSSSSAKDGPGIGVAKEEYDEDEGAENGVGETSAASAPSSYHNHHMQQQQFGFHHHVNVSRSINNNGS